MNASGAGSAGLRRRAGRRLGRPIAAPHVDDDAERVPQREHFVGFEGLDVHHHPHRIERVPGGARVTEKIVVDGDVLLLAIPHGGIAQVHVKPRGLVDGGVFFQHAVYEVRFAVQVDHDPGVVGVGPVAQVLDDRQPLLAGRRRPAGFDRALRRGLRRRLALGGSYRRRRAPPRDRSRFDPARRHALELPAGLGGIRALGILFDDFFEILPRRSLVGVELQPLVEILVENTLQEEARGGKLPGRLLEIDAVETPDAEHPFPARALGGLAGAQFPKALLAFPIGLRSAGTRGR